ncbi:MAG: M48 family metallopeptidase [Candidatus Brocadiales bacterium]
MVLSGEKGELERKSKEYARRRYALTVLGMFVTIGFLVFTAIYLTLPLKGLAEGLVTGYYAQIGVYYVGFCLMFLAVSLPLDFYSGYIIEHRYGLSNQTVMAWAKNQLKSGGLGFAITLPMVEAVYYAIKNYPEYWWIHVGILFTLISVVMARIAPVLILPLFYKSTPIDDEALREALTPLAADAGVTLEGVYKIDMSKDTKKANAMLAGLGGTRRVILGDTLLEKFSNDEIAVVFAHELGHHVYRHIWKFLGVAGIAALVGLYIASRVLGEFASELGFAYTYDIATLPLLLLVLGVFAIIVLPLQNYYSRRLEAQCDAYALEKTRNPAVFIDLMTKLAENNLADKDPSGIIEYLFYDHPTIAKRIDMARRWAAGRHVEMGPKISPSP